MTSVNMEFYDGARDMVKSGTPLRKFRGKFIGSGDDPNSMRIFPHVRESQGDNSFGGQVVDLNFLDVDVIESTDPYPGKTVQLNINYRVGAQTNKPSERGAWGILVKSLVTVPFPGHEAGDDNVALKDLLGESVLMECEPEHDYGVNQTTNEPMQGMVWRVTEVGAEGSASGETAEDYFLNTIHGSDRTTFSAAVLQNPHGRGEHQAAIMDGTLISMLVAGEKIEQDGDTFWVVGRARE